MSNQYDQNLTNSPNSVRLWVNKILPRSQFCITKLPTILSRKYKKKTNVSNGLMKVDKPRVRLGRAQLHVVSRTRILTAEGIFCLQVFLTSDKCWKTLMKNDDTDDAMPNLKLIYSPEATIIIYSYLCKYYFMPNPEKNKGCPLFEHIYLFIYFLKVILIYVLF